MPSSAAILVGPLISVAVVAWTFGNPFNGTLFLLIALLLAATAGRLPDARVGATHAAAVAGDLVARESGERRPMAGGRLRRSGGN